MAMPDRNIYVAAPYSCRDALRAWLDLNLPPGWALTSSWLTETHDVTHPGHLGASDARPYDEVRAHFRQDLLDLDMSDYVIVLTGAAAAAFNATDVAHTGGRHVETGYALGLGVPIVVVGPVENIFQRAGCLNVDTLQQALDLIRSDEVRDMWAEVRF